MHEQDARAHTDQHDSSRSSSTPGKQTLTEKAYVPSASGSASGSASANAGPVQRRGSSDASYRHDLGYDLSGRGSYPTSGRVVQRKLSETNIEGIYCDTRGDGYCFEPAGLGRYRNLGDNVVYNYSTLTRQYISDDGTHFDAETQNYFQSNGFGTYVRDDGTPGQYIYVNYRYVIQPMLPSPMLSKFDGEEGEREKPLKRKYEKEKDKDRDSSSKSEELEKEKKIAKAKLRELGGIVLDAPPPKSVRIAFHFTSPEGAIAMKQSGIVVSKALSGSGGAVSGINRDGEGFYTTEDGDWPYYKGDKDSVKFGVFIGEGVFELLTKTKPVNEVGFSDKPWWQDDPELAPFIHDFDVIIRHESSTDIKFNPQATKYICLVQLGVKKADKELVEMRSKMFGEMSSPSKFNSSTPTTLTEGQQKDILATFGTPMERDEQTRQIQEYAKTNSLNWRDIASFLRGHKLRD